MYPDQPVIQALMILCFSISAASFCTGCFLWLIDLVKASKDLIDYDNR